MPPSVAAVHVTPLKVLNNSATHNISLDLTLIGVPKGAQVKVRDVWEGRDDATLVTDGVINRAVSRRFPLTPLRFWLFTPELQWQPRGKMAYLTGGVSTGNARARCARIAR